MSDLVGNPEDRFSRVAADMYMYYNGKSVTQVYYAGSGPIRFGSEQE